MGFHTTLNLPVPELMALGFWWPESSGLKGHIGWG